MDISTRNMSLLPEADRLRRLSISLAMLDAILDPDVGSRCHRFDASWKEDVALGSMYAAMSRSGGPLSGYHVVFTPQGMLLAGFAIDAPMSPYNNADSALWPGVVDAVPAELVPYLSEQVLNRSLLTFCLWNTRRSGGWQHGEVEFPDIPDPDGSGELLALLDGNPETYVMFADSHYGREVEGWAVEQVYQHEALTPGAVSALNPQQSPEAVESDRARIGYPQ